MRPRRGHVRGGGPGKRDRVVSARKLAGAGLALLLVVACGPPVNVRRVSPRTVTTELSRSALNSNDESLFSDNVLYRWNLREQFKQNPEVALRVLDDKVVDGTGGR